MVLEKDVAFLVVAEVGPVLVLAIGHKGVPFLIVTLIFNEFHTIEPMLDMVALDLHHRCVPGRDVEGFIRWSGNQVIKRSQGPVSFDSELGVRMPQIVQDLELATYG